MVKPMAKPKNKTIEPERSLNQFCAINFVLKTNGPDISIILLNDFRKPKKTNITSAFLVPYGNQKARKTLKQVFFLLNKKSKNQ